MKQLEKQFGYEKEFIELIVNMISTEGQRFNFYQVYSYLKENFFLEDFNKEEKNEQENEENGQNNQNENAIGKKNSFDGF